ncbi:MAG: hypothetical protein ABR530_06970 [Pyrinomonadaceae bacterium]
MNTSMRKAHSKFRMTGLMLCLLFAVGNAAAQKGKPKPVIYKVDVAAHNYVFTSPTYLPTCSAETKDGTYSAWFPRHDPCAIVTLDTGYKLTDDIMLRVNTDSNGNIVSVQLRGQDVIGTEGIMHETEVVMIAPVSPAALGFTLHVDQDVIPVWKLSRHRDGSRVEIVGYISLGDLVYSRKP